MYCDIVNLVKTDDSEITAVMLPQRTCGAESQVENKLSNGPRRAYQKALCA